MKTYHPMLLALLGLAFAAGGSFASAADAPAAAAAKPQVTVTFDHPENFTDIKDAFSPTEKGEQYNLDSLKNYLIRTAPGYIPAGSHLAITFTDIDLAGDFEPMRGPQFDQVRIMKDIYPPRANLSFTLTDADGKVLKAGQRRLINMNYLMDAAFLPNRDDPLVYDKALLRNWLGNEFTKN